MKERDFTRASFDAAHKGEYAEQIHGHTWWVEIEWDANPPRNAIFMNAKLKQYLEASFDHRLLDDVIPDPTNIGVARALLSLMGDEILKIKVWRDGNCPCGAKIER
jgi:6-pyruvoyl-tetrahydropterin synthase